MADAGKWPRSLVGAQSSPARHIPISFLILTLALLPSQRSLGPEY